MWCSSFFSEHAYAENDFVGYHWQNTAFDQKSNDEEVSLIGFDLVPPLATLGTGTYEAWDNSDQTFSSENNYLYQNQGYAYQEHSQYGNPASPAARVNACQIQDQIYAQTDGQAQFQAQAQAQTQADLQAKAQAQAAAEARLKAQTQAQSAMQAQLKAQIETQAQVQAQLQAQARLQAQIYAQAYHQIQNEAHAQAEAEAKSQAEIQAYAQAQAEAYAKTQAEALAQVQAQAKAQAEAQALAQARTYAKAYAQAYDLAQAYAKKKGGSPYPMPQPQASFMNPCAQGYYPAQQYQPCSQNSYPGNLQQNTGVQYPEPADCCQEQECPCEEYPLRGPWDAKIKVGLVYPVSESLRRFYSSAFPIYQLEGSYTACNGWGGWGNIGYATKKGHAKLDIENCTECTIDESHLKNGTRMQILQLGLGFDYTFDITCNFSAFLGAGLTYSFLWIKNQSDFVNSDLNKGGIGGIVKSGLSYYFTECFHADLFLDYNYTQFNLKHFDYQTINFGIGVGITF